MKKIIICLFACAALIVTSCGNKDNSEGKAAVNEMQELLQSDNTEGLSAAMSNAQEAIQKLVSEGKIEEAKAYALSVQEFIDANSDEIKAVVGEESALGSIVDAIKSVPTGAGASLDEVRESVENAANDVKGGVQEAFEEMKEEALSEKDRYSEQAKEAAEKAKEQANEAIENAKEQANEAVENAKQQANEAVNKAAEDAKQKATDATNKAVDNAANKLKNAFKKK